MVLSGTSFTTRLDPATPPGTYQVRVIALSASDQVSGTFSDAVPVVVQCAPQTARSVRLRQGGNRSGK